MSIVVGLAVGKHRIIAGDQRESTVDGHKFDRAPKVYHMKTGLLGFTGSVEPESKLVSVLRKADDPTQASLPKGEYEALFYSRNGKVYVIGGGKVVVSENRAAICLGSAYQYAYGAVWAIDKAFGKKSRSKEYLIKLARMGVRAGIEFNNTCGGRVQVKYMEVV